MSTLNRMIQGTHDTEQTARELNAKGSTIGGAIDSMIKQAKGLAFCHYHQEILRDGDACYTCQCEEQRN